MKNTLENKAKFFAQYWGQEVLGSDMYGSNGLIYSATMKTKLHDGGSYLELTPLSQISNEDAIEVARVVCPEMFYHAGLDPIKIERQDEWLTVCRKRNIYLVDIDFLGYTTCQNENVEYKRNSVGTTQAIDYLRSRGYALPWRGISVETLIKWGWVKLKEGVQS